MSKRPVRDAAERLLRDMMAAGLRVRRAQAKERQRREAARKPKKR